MRSSMLLTALFTIGGLTSPLGKRDFVTDVVVVTDIVYVTAGEGAAATSTTAPEAEAAAVTVVQYAGESTPFTTYGGGWNHHHHQASSTSVAVAPVETSTSAPVVESSTPVVTSEAAATSKAAATSATSSAPLASGADYDSQVIYSHNIHRANHSASALVWDDNLAAAAQKIASSCVYGHELSAVSGPYGPSASGYEGYGQNIAAGYPASGISGTISDLFYNGEVNSFLPSYYGEANPPDFDSWGHFSQIVWDATTNVGCATVDCTANGGLTNFGGIDPFFTVCNYWPEGNMGGEYGSNILPSKNEATIHGVSS